MNCKAKGTRAELRCIKDLEARDYLCTRAGASLGAFDVVALHPIEGAKFIQVKSGTSRLSRKDRAYLERIAPYSSGITLEYWHWDRKWTRKEAYNPWQGHWEVESSALSTASSTTKGVM